MPTILYHCKDCGKDEKVFYSSIRNYPQEIDCDCGSKKIRTYGNMSMILKGDGYYVTDMKKGTVKTND